MRFSSSANVWVNKDTKVIVQGFTGSKGPSTEQAIAYGTDRHWYHPGKGGQTHRTTGHNTVEEAKSATNCDASMIYVPPPFRRRCDAGSGRSRDSVGRCHHGELREDMVEVEQPLAKADNYACYWA